MRSIRLFLHSPAVFFIAISICAPSLLAAQDKPAHPQPAPASPAALPLAAKSPDVSKEGLVIEKVYTRIRMEADGTGTRQVTSRTRLLADSGVKQMAVLTFTYTASNQQIDIGYVRVVKPDGTVVVTPDYNIQDMPADVTREAPMYSDIHQKHVAVKGLSVGDTLESQVTLRTIKPEIPGQFWFDYSFERNLIVLDEQLDLDLPAAKPVTVASSDLQPTITAADGRKLYHWASSNLARPDPDAPPKSTNKLKPSVQVTTFASWDQVGAWYQSLQQDSLAITPAIQAKADALTKGLTSDEDKIRAIFNDVALHIHYVGLEFGIGRYQPHPADDVLSNEYGDCKDKHTLLASELKAVGIQAWPVLISSSSELDPATPSPAQFDHVITLVPLAGKLLWMDSTEEVAPVGVLFGTLRDKQALAIPTSKPAYLERTPVDLPQPRTVRLQVEGKLSDHGLFSGHISQTSDGDIGMIFRLGFRRTPESQWKELMQRIAGAEGYGGEVSNPQVSAVEQIDKPLNFSFDYTREKYYQWDDNDTSHWVSAPLPSIGGELAPGVKETKPADDIDLGATGKTDYIATMQLPTGWTMTPPPNVDLKEDWLEYHSTYSFKNGVFKAERVATVKKNKVPLDQWDKYLAFRRGMFEDLNHQVTINPHWDLYGHTLEADALHFDDGTYSTIVPKSVLEQLHEPGDFLRESDSILETSTPTGGHDLEVAIDMSRKALDKIEAKTLTVPPDDAQSLYWTQLLSNAWCTVGWSALEAKDLPTAENYLRAAWQLSQDRICGYQFGRLLEASGQKAAAAHQYELAHVASSEHSFGGFVRSTYKVDDRILESYKKLTGRELTSTPLNHGQYNGSLRAELDKDTEIRAYTKSSRLTGNALYAVAYEEGKPVKAYFLQGDKGFAPMTTTLESHRFPITMPKGSKARILREVRLICAPYGGCDAYMLLPATIQIPARNGLLDVSPPPPPPGTKVIHIPSEP
ncbi:MAG: DUF3857 and transglutaminase domain-containing protein [Terracidiphilus sp.]|jgi:hypothetical protein